MAIGFDGAALDGGGYARSREGIPALESVQTSAGIASRPRSSSTERLNTRRSCSPSQRRVTSILAATASQCSTKSGTSPAQALAAVCPIHRRWQGLPHEQRGRTCASRLCAGPKVLALRRLRARRRPSSDLGHVDYDGKAQRRRSTGLAGRRARAHRRHPAGSACRITAVELEATESASGRLIRSRYAAVLGVGLRSRQLVVPTR
jgi:hypothetical protein